MIIHEHSVAALDRAPVITVDSVPLHQYVGSAESLEGDVSELRFLGFTSEGDLVGFDNLDYAVVVLPRDSSARRSFGRRGSGPEEFGDVEALAVARGDTIAIYDPDHRRMTIVHPVEGIVEMVSHLEIPGRWGIRMVGQTTTGAWAVAQSCFGTCHTVGDAPGLKQWPIRVSFGRLLDSNYTERFKLPGQPTVLNIFEINGSTAFNGYKVHFSIAPQVRAWGEGLLVVADPAWQIEQRDTLGRPTFLVRVASAPRPVTAELWAASVEERLRSRIDDYPEINVDATREALAAEERSETVPALSRVWVTPGDVAWLLDYRLPGDSGWAATAVDLDGRILGRIIEPSGDPPVAFGNDRLAFRTEDEDGIATITVRRIRFPS